MGDENSNQPRTLGDYSRPSHKDYRNAIELPEGAKVSPLRSDTIKLVQNGCAFHGLISEDPIQLLKDFLRIVDSIDLNGATRNTTRLRLFCFSLRDQAINWLDRLPAGSISTWDDLTTRFLNRFKDLLRRVPHHGLDLWLQVQIFYDHVDYTTQMAIDYAAGGRLRKLSSEEAWETIEDLTQYEEEEWNEPIFSEKGSPDYIDANLEQELESMERRVESLMRSEVLLYYEGGFTSPKRPYQEEFKEQILKLINDQKDQIKQLEEYMRKTKDTFMCLADSLIATLKVKIEAQRVHPTKIEKITRFPTHTASVTPKTLKPTMVHRVSMISKIKPTKYRTSHQHLNSNLKMPILHSFEENKLEYEDEDAVEIKMMETRMDKESFEHNLYENDIILIICYNFSLTSNPPIKPKDPGNFKMKVVKPLTIHTPPSPHVAYFHQNGRKTHFLEDKQIPSVRVFDEVFSIWKAFGGNTCDLCSFGEEMDKITDLHQNLLKIMLTKRGDGVASIKRRRHDLRSDGISTLVTSSEHGRPKGTLEDLVS
ncbi:zinc finger, CCHC-type containing protein [Tanacetum coccineum]